MTTVRHIEPSALGLTQASTLAAVVRSSEAESATLTRSLTPSNCSAPPCLPVTRVAPETLPWLLRPDVSSTVVPDASSKLQAPTRPVEAGAGAGGAGGAGVGAGGAG